MYKNSKILKIARRFKILLIETTINNKGMPKNYFKIHIILDKVVKYLLYRRKVFVSFELFFLPEKQNHLPGMQILVFEMFLLKDFSTLIGNFFLVEA